MLALAKHERRDGMILLIHADDLSASFPGHWTHIELELDHLRILCALNATFRSERPEIRDLRLSCWLRAKRGAGKLDASDGWLNMVSVYDGVFRLTPAERGITEQLPAQSADSEIATQPSALANPAASPTAPLAAVPYFPAIAAKEAAAYSPTAKPVLNPKPPRTTAGAGPENIRANRKPNLAARAS